MSNVLKTGLEHLAAQLALHAAETVIYARGYDSVTVKAVIGRTKLKTTDGTSGVKVEWTDKDFLIPIPDLKFDDVQIVPERGDLIYWTVGDVTKVFEVRPFSYEPPYRDDPLETIYRIHAKQIRTEPYY